MIVSWKRGLGFSLIFPACVAMTGAAHAAQSAAPAAEPAQSYPSKPIRIVVGFTPGGVADIAARVVATKLAENWKQQVVVDNRPGAGSAIGTGIVAASEPNGYTMISVSAAHAIIPALYSKLPFDSERDFAGVAVTCTGPLLLIASSSAGVKSVKDLIALAKTRPGQLNFASAGIGSATHFAMEVFNSKAGVNIVHVPYKGVPEALTDTMTGRVQLFVSPLINAIPQVKGGKVVALGVTTTFRSALLPDVPTIAESGMPGFEVISWQGLCTPAGVQEAVLGRIRAGLAAALASPDTKKQLADQGMQPTPLMAEKFAAFIRAERAKWAKVVKDVGIVPQ